MSSLDLRQRLNSGSGALPATPHPGEQQVPETLQGAPRGLRLPQVQPRPSAAPPTSKPQGASEGRPRPASSPPPPGAPRDR